MENILERVKMQEKLEMVMANLKVVEHDVAVAWLDFAKKHIHFVRESLDELEAEIDKHL